MQIVPVLEIFEAVHRRGVLLVAWALLWDQWAALTTGATRSTVYNHGYFVHLHAMPLVPSSHKQFIVA